MSAHLWKEIAKTIGMVTMDCTKKWKNLRDEDVCFLKTKKRKSDHNKEWERRRKKVPALCFCCGWQHIKHQDRTTR